MTSFAFYNIVFICGMSGSAVELNVTFNPWVQNNPGRAVEYANGLVQYIAVTLQFLRFTGLSCASTFSRLQYSKFENYRTLYFYGKIQ